MRSYQIIFYLYFPNNTIIYILYMDFFQYHYINCCPLQPSSGGIVVHRKIESRGAFPHTQWVHIYYQYLHNRQRIYTVIKTSGKDT